VGFLFAGVLYEAPQRPRSNEQLLLTAFLSEAASSRRSPAAFCVISPQQSCGRYVVRMFAEHVRLRAEH
jgi:hypothetical protein